MADQVKYTQKLKGDRVLVIGGSAGIGFGAAEALLENGCTVIISSSNPDRVQKTIAKLQASYPSAKGRISGHACDLGNDATLDANIKELLEKTTSNGGKLDHIIHTAGDSLAVMPIEGIDFQSVKQAGMVRFFAPLFIAKHAAQYLNPGPKSSITFTTGGVSDRPIPQWSVVNSYATGLQGMTRGLALDLKPIRVNLVSPGAVETDLWAGLPPDQKEGMLKSIAAKVPVGKVATVEDIAESYVYLLRDRNITGEMVSTSGGHLIV